MSRILIHEPSDCGEQCLLPLATGGLEIVRSVNRESLIDAMVERRPDVLVYVLGHLPQDLVMLSMFRRVAPNLPMILLGGPTDLAARRAIQDLKPTYYGVLPLDGSELSDAVRGALDAARRPRGEHPVERRSSRDRHLSRTPPRGHG